MAVCCGKESIKFFSIVFFLLLNKRFYIFGGFATGECFQTTCTCTCTLLWRVENVYLCSALIAIEQWWFFSVQHLLWHESSDYKGHLRGPVTPTPIAERLAVGLSLPVFMTLSYDFNTEPKLAVMFLKV